MKILLALLLLVSSLPILAQQNQNTGSEDKVGASPQTEQSASSRLIQKKREKLRGTRPAPPQEQEARIHDGVDDDFDPRADAIDDDLTKDEGMSEE